MKWWGWVMLAAGLLAAGGAAVYEGLEWKYVRRAQERIEALPTEEEAAGRRKLYGDGQTSLYSGLLAGTSGKSVWVWRGNSLERWRVEEGTAYSYFSGCGQAGVGRWVSEDGRQWRGRVRKGDVVGALWTGETRGRKAAREVIGYDWWLFLPGGMEELCAR